ncbi:MAG: type II toxin-antitoxin system RelE/ParE family toxin [Gemmataceae bacterium]
MKTYTVEFARPARKDLESLPATLQDRLLRAIEKLGTNPHPPGSLKLKGSESSYRIRVGSYRVIYEIEDDIVVVLIVRVRHRREAYD